MGGGIDKCDNKVSKKRRKGKNVKVHQNTNKNFINNWLVEGIKTCNVGGGVVKEGLENKFRTIRKCCC